MLSKQNPSLMFHPTVPVAHRANCGDLIVPENTLSALFLAYKTGAKWVECDVKTTADGIMIVIHDETLKRTTNAAGTAADKPVAQMTYAEIAQFDAGCKASPRFAGEKIPTLAVFLRLIKTLNMGLLLEIKPAMGHDIETARKAVQLLVKYDLINHPRLLIHSFLVECLREVKRLQPRLNTGLLITEWGAYTRINTGISIYPPLGIYKCKESLEQVLRDLQCTALLAYEKIRLTRDMIATTKKETGVNYVLGWTVNQPEQASELFSQGVDAVLSDNHQIITALTQRTALASNCALYQSYAAAFHEQQNMKMQHEHDKQHGLIKR